jgi:hypothetical protein
MTNEPPPEPIMFRLYPERRYLYFVGAIWETLLHMHWYLESVGVENLAYQIGHVSATTTGLCRDYKATRQRRNGTVCLSGQCGEVHLSREDLSADLVAHELTHATINWARRVRINPLAKTGSADNERFCRAVGSMVGQFNRHAARLKVPLGKRP